VVLVVLVVVHQGPLQLLLVRWAWQLTCARTAGT
jgi:hypothetical protein